MSCEELTLLARMAVSLGLREVVASGGEPFHVPSVVAALTRICSKHGLDTHAITSATWARSKRLAREMLSRTGPWSRLAVSCDDFHQEHIPIERCVYVLEAAKEQGIPVSIATVDGARSSLDAIPPMAMEGVRVISQPLMGREPMPWSRLAEPCVNMAVPYCEAGEQVYACCGDLCELGMQGPLYLGTTTELRKRGIGPEHRLLMRYLRVLGPLALYRAVAPDASGGPSPFTSVCQLCLALFSLPDARARVHEHLYTEKAQARVALAEAVLFADTH